MKFPLVSVYIPTHNRKEMLERAIQSIQNQSYPNIEIIVVNDGSKDGTKELLKNYKSSFPISSINIDVPKGACNARNLAIMSANGEFVTGLDDDDEFEKDHILNLYNAYSDKYSFICTNIKVFDGVKTKTRKSHVGVITLKSILHYNKVGNQVFVKKERVIECGLYSNTFPSFQDYDLWVSLIHKYGPAKKMFFSSYIQNIGHELNRISNNKWKVNLGLFMFYRKYRYLMSNEHVSSFKFLYLKQNKQAISKLKLVKYMNSGNILPVMMYLLCGSK